MEALIALGHRVEEAPFFGGEVAEFLPIMQFMTKNAPVFWERGLEPMSRWMRSEGRRHRKSDILARIHAIQGRIDRWFSGADAWLTPTVAVEPPAESVGAAGLEPAAKIAALAPLGLFTAPFDAAGMPAVSLPLGRPSKGSRSGSRSR